MPATACPSRRLPGTLRVVPGPLRAKGTSPLGTPDCRRRTVNDGPITRLQLAIAPPCHAPPALAPAPFDGSPGSPSLRLRSPVPLHSGRFGLRFSGHARCVSVRTRRLAASVYAQISCPAGPSPGLAGRLLRPGPGRRKEGSQPLFKACRLSLLLVRPTGIDARVAHHEDGRVLALL